MQEIDTLPTYLPTYLPNKNPNPKIILSTSTPSETPYPVNSAAQKQVPIKKIMTKITPKGVTPVKNGAS